MKNHTGKEVVINVEEKNRFDIRENIAFLDNLDNHKDFLIELYKTVISRRLWPEDRLFMLHDGIKEIKKALDLAWIMFDEANSNGVGKEISSFVDPTQPTYEDYQVDQNYELLRVSKWIRERRKRFYGNIQFLNQHEIYWSHLFYQALFSIRSLHEWKDQLDTWLEFAIDNKSITDDSGISSEEVYSFYESLQKITEITWLERKQEYDLLYHETNVWFDINNYPVFSTLDYLMNPFCKIFGFFHWVNLYERKKSVNKWLKTVYLPNQIWNGQVTELIDLFQSLNELIECCWLIKELGRDYPKSWNYINTRFSGARKPEHPNVKFTLTEKWTKKPENYLLEFFDEYSLLDTFHMLFECLHGAFSNEESSNLFEKKDINSFQISIIMLIEAAYLIQAKKFPNRKE